MENKHYEHLDQYASTRLLTDDKAAIVCAAAAIVEQLRRLCGIQERILEELIKLRRQEKRG